MRLLALSIAVLACPCGSSNEGSTTPDDAAPEAAADASTTDTTSGDTAAADTATDATDASTSYADEAGVWKMVWSDEFDGPDGSEVDRSKWTYDDPMSGQWNKELEYYVPSKANAEQRGGNLVITATPDGADKYKCWYGTCKYTSARLISKGLYSTKYGRVAARIQIPKGQGMWPAFWMLGDDIDKVSWPACGEIDIMENIGKNAKTDYGTLHATGFDKGGSLDGAAPLADGFHVYAAEWDASGISFFLDDAKYITITPADVPASGKWAFDHPFFLLLNVAVGGNWPGDPDATTTFPQTMKVDWVRVYQKS